MNTYTDVFPAVLSVEKPLVLKQGRPKKGTVNKMAGFEVSTLDDERFYLKLAGYNEKEIDTFIARYLPFPLQINGQLADKKYVITFQKKMATISQLLDSLLKHRKSKYEFTHQAMLNTVTNLVNLVNDDLASCRITFTAPILSLKEITKAQRTKYRSTKMENLIDTLRDEGGQFNQAKLVPFPMLYCKYDNIFSWCILNLIDDKLSGLDTSVCECGRIFLRKRSNQIFCRNRECVAERNNNRTRKSRRMKAVKKTQP